MSITSADPIGVRRPRWRRRHAAGALAAGLLAVLYVGAARAADDGSNVPSGTEIVMRALSFLGVPYRPGGEDPALGFDCSGLVQYVFSLASGPDLPRRAKLMSRIGRSVGVDVLAPGDLLFFNTLGRPFSHVAVYIGEGRFVHAPARGGQVRIESMRFPYWRARFNGARRIAPQERAQAEATGQIATDEPHRGAAAVDYRD